MKFHYFILFQCGRMQEMCGLGRGLFQGHGHGLEELRMLSQLVIGRLRSPREAVNAYKCMTIIEDLHLTHCARITSGTMKAVRLLIPTSASGSQSN